MSELMETDQAESVCTKRSWVMSTLTDDERIDQSEALPQALRLHLSRCDSCRILANHLQSVTVALSQVADGDPPNHLLALAKARACHSIDRGGALTGRVNVSNLDGVDGEEHKRATAWRLLPFAAAAIVLVGFASIWMVGQTRPVVPMVSGPDSWNPARPARRGAVEDAPSDHGPATAMPDDRQTEVPPKLAASEKPHDRQRTDPFSRTACKHRSLIEAASCDDPNCVSGVPQHPDRQQRILHWGGIFDSPLGDYDDTRLFGHETPPKR